MDPAIPEKAIRGFESWTGLQVCVHDLEGALTPVIDVSRYWHGGSVCRVAKTSLYAHRCHQFEVTELRPRLPQMKEGRVSRCHAGLVEWTVPVMEEDRVLAVLFAGQTLAAGWEPPTVDSRSPVKTGTRLRTVSREDADLYLEGLRQLAARLLCWIHEARFLHAPRNRASVIFQYIEENFNKSPSLEGLSRVLFLSLSRTSHVLRESTGSSFGELLLRARLRNACYLLRHSDLPIVEVAARSGFNDLSHFHKMFRNKLGTTPRHWRISLES